LAGTQSNWGSQFTTVPSNTLPKVDNLSPEMCGVPRADTILLLSLWMGIHVHEGGVLRKTPHSEVMTYTLGIGMFFTYDFVIFHFFFGLLWVGFFFFFFSNSIFLFPVHLQSEVSVNFVCHHVEKMSLCISALD
jgi:hypothetical protein